MKAGGGEDRGVTLERKRLARALVMLPLCAFMLYSPFDQHKGRGEGGERSKYTHGWKFFRSYGIGTCVVQTELQEPDGRRVALDRYALLGYVPEDAPGWLRKTKGKKDLLIVAGRMCSELGAARDRLRMHARCATREGWEVVDDGREAACARWAHHNKRARAAGTK